MKKLYRKLTSLIKCDPLDKTIEIGTVVQIKSGGFGMTVQDIAIEDKWIENQCLYRKGDFLCRWATKDGHYDEKWFAANTVISK